MTASSSFTRSDLTKPRWSGTSPTAAPIGGPSPASARTSSWLPAWGPLCRSAGQKDNLSIGLVDDTTVDQMRSALDQLTPVERLLDLGEEATGGLKFADCIPGWLADSIVLARLTDSEAVASVTSKVIDTAR